MRAPKQWRDFSSARLAGREASMTDFSLIQPKSLSRNVTTEPDFSLASKMRPSSESSFHSSVLAHPPRVSRCSGRTTPLPSGRICMT